MCELLAMSCRSATRLTLSLQALAAHSGATYPHRDGWGAAFFDGFDLALFREARPAVGSPLVQFLEDNGPTSSLVISHIRRATQGAISLANTQPFVREWAGREHAFAHNGNLVAITKDAQFGLSDFQCVGETDSEHAFCALMQRIRCLWLSSAAPPALADRMAVVTQFAADLRRLGPANFLYADGEYLFAHGHQRTQVVNQRIEPPGLFMLARRCHEGHTPVALQGVQVGCGYQEVVLVASVALSDEAWQPLAEGEVLAIAQGKVLLRSTAI